MAFKLRSSGAFKMMGSSPIKQEDKKSKTMNAQLDGTSNTNLSSKFKNQPRYKDDIRDYEDKLAVYNLNKKQIESGEDPESGDSLESEYYGKLNSIWTDRENDGLVLKGNYSDGRPYYLRHYSDANTMEKLGKPPALTPRSIKTITPKLNTDPVIVEPKKAKLPPELREKKKEVKTKRTKRTKRVKHPKGTKTRNLVTGDKNRTRRSTGTSKRKNRTIAGLTFWNSKD